MKNATAITLLGLAGIGAYLYTREDEDEESPERTMTPTELSKATSVAYQQAYTAETFPAATQQTRPEILEQIGLEDSGITFSLWKRTFETSEGQSSGYRMKVGGPATDGQFSIRVSEGQMLSPAESIAGGNAIAFYPEFSDALEAMQAYISIFQTELIA